MELNEATRLRDLLSEYPFLKEELPRINPKFKMLSSPFGKVMARKATIKDMSVRSGTPIKDLIAGIKAIIAEFE